MSSILNTYIENEQALKRFLRRFVTRGADVEDLAQEAFVRAYAAEALETVHSPKSFLFKVARNLALNERAKFANATTVALEDLPGGSVLEDADQNTIEAQMDAREQVRALAAAIASLPPQCSRVFLLRKVHGLSFKQISEQLGISVSTAEKHAALGLLRCSEYLRRQGFEIGVRAPSGDQERQRQVANLEARRRDRSRDE